jgi:hypothetical protein
MDRAGRTGQGKEESGEQWTVSREWGEGEKERGGEGEREGKSESEMVRKWVSAKV